MMEQALASVSYDYQHQFNVRATHLTCAFCANCLRAVTPFLNAEPSVARWQVDTANPAKILTVEGENPIPEQVMKAVLQAGFDIEPVG